MNRFRTDSGHFERVIDLDYFGRIVRLDCLLPNVKLFCSIYRLCVSDWFVLPPECGGEERNYLEL